MKIKSKQGTYSMLDRKDQIIPASDRNDTYYQPYLNHELWLHKVYKIMVNTVVLVYVIAWLAATSGINSVSNTGRKIVIVQDTAEHYYTFHT